MSSLITTSPNNGKNREIEVSFLETVNDCEYLRNLGIRSDIPMIEYFDSM